jgi:ribosomal protein L34
MKNRMYTKGGNNIKAFRRAKEGYQNLGFTRN